MNQSAEEASLPQPLLRPPVWVMDIVNAVLIVGLAFLPLPGHELRPGGAVAAIVVIAPAVLLPLRRRWPIPVLGLCVALYGVAALTGTLSPGVVLAASIAMFGVARRSGRRTTLIVAAATMAAIALLSLLAAVTSIGDPRVFGFAVTVAFAAAAGDASRSRREYIRAVTERAERAERTREAEARRRVSEERLRIARDLHDAVAHQISVISLNAGVASANLENRPEKSGEALVAIRAASRTVLREIGDLMEMLRTGSDDADGVSTSPQRGLSQLDELLARFADAGLAVNVRSDGDRARLVGAPDLVAYRVIQEALTNAHKHGAEHRAHVLIRIDDDSAEIVVTNPVGVPGAGSAMDPPVTGGHGLLGLRERVASVRGAVTTGTTPGGFRVAATIPLTKEER